MGLITNDSPEPQPLAYAFDMRIIDENIARTVSRSILALVIAFGSVMALEFWPFGPDLQKCHGALISASLTSSLLTIKCGRRLDLSKYH